MSGLSQIKYQALETGGSHRNTTMSSRQARNVMAVKVQKLERTNEALHAENTERKSTEARSLRGESYFAEAQRRSHAGSFGWRFSMG